MNLIKSLKFVAAIPAVICFVFLLKSCKKVDSNNISKADLTALTAQKEAMIKAIKKKYGDIGAGIVFPVNKKAEDLLYRTKEGKMTNMFKSETEKSNNSFGGGHTNGGFCQYDCSNASSIGQLVQIFTLNSIQRFYECESNGSKSTIVVSWTISVPYPLIASVGSPVNYGRFNIYSQRRFSFFFTRC